MTRKKKRIERAPRRTDRIRLSRRQWKIAAAVMAMAIAAVVLIVSTTGAPDNGTEPVDRVVATLDGEEITESDVAEAQVVIFWAYNRYSGRHEALEHLIAERLLYREAEREGYSPTEDETWQELILSIALRGVTLEELEDRLEWENLSLEEYLEHFRRMLAINTFLEDTVEIPEITEEDIRQFYEGYVEHQREKYPGKDPPSLEEMKNNIIVVLERQKRQQAATDLIQQLREKADIQYMDVDW